MSDAELYLLATILKNLNLKELERLESTLDEMIEEDKYAEVNLPPLQ